MAVDFYGLTAKAFGLAPDPTCCFRSATHRKALSCVAYGLAQGGGIVVITGERGSGKSTLAGHLLRTIDRQELTLGQVAAPDSGEGDLVRLVAQSFGLDVEGQAPAGVLAATEAFLQGEARAGRRSLLIIDDGQNLPTEALEQLSVMASFALGDRPLLQVLLFGRHALRATLRSAPLERFSRQVIAAHQLGPIERAEIEAYVVHRLERAGWTGCPQFDQRVLAELHQASGGLPLHINRIAGRLLVLGAIGQRTRIDAIMLKAVLDELAAEDSSAEASLEPNPPPGASEPLVDQAKLAAMLAERDAQIAELQQAVVELANQQDSADGARAEIAALLERMEGLESRVAEQDSTICQTLTMLIEWIEGEGDQTRAA